MKRLLLTGGTGFVGRNIKPILKKQYEVSTLGRSKGNDIVSDLSEESPSLAERYDIVLHAASKVHTTPKTTTEIEEFDNVNYQGTVHLCSSLEQAGLPDTFIFISTVAVYGCDKGEKIDEGHVLKPKTPYAFSKLKAEDYLRNWCLTNKIHLCILRPSLILGPYPPGNLGLMIKGLSSGRYLSIGDGNARKSVLMVYDIARLVPLLEGKDAIYNLCSDDQPSIRDLETIICCQLHKKMPLHIPYYIAKCLAVLGDLIGKNAPFNTNKMNKMTDSLTFSNKKVKAELGWAPLCVKDNFRII